MRNSDNTLPTLTEIIRDYRLIDFTKCESCSKLVRVLDTQIIEASVICNPCIDIANEFGDGELSNAT